MNTSFTLKNVEVAVSDEVSIKIGEISTSVTDYHLLEGLQVAKELPSILTQIKDVIISGIKEVEEIQSGITASAFEDKPLRASNPSNREELCSHLTEPEPNDIGYSFTEIGKRPFNQPL